MIRINPDISSESHPYIQTGLKTSKFGILREGIDSLVEKASKSGLINLKGIASHVGSQIFNKELIFENLNLLIEIANNLIRTRACIKLYRFRWRPRNQLSRRKGAEAEKTCWKR